ncbi:MAG: FmdB family zinc ribbon protein [Spirochaetia bacterium]
MPTYEYECRNCGHRFDQFQNMSDDPLRDCPSCAEPALKRLVGGGIGVIFKGSGFYVTDSKSSGSAKKPAAQTNAAQTNGDSSGGSSTSGTESPGSSTKSGDSASSKSDGGSSSSGSSGSSGETAAKKAG